MILFTRTSAYTAQRVTVSLLYQRGNLAHSPMDTDFGPD